MQPSDLYEFGEFRLDVRNARLTRAAEAVPLPPKTFDLLVALVRRGGELLDKDTLMREVWPGTFVEEANISRHVWTLRRALGDDGYIETVSKRGYRFTAAVRIPSIPEIPPAPPSRRWLWSAAGAAVALIALTAAALPRGPAPDAGKWFGLAETAREQGRFRDAVPLYKHAIELDPSFALAESRLSDTYGALREPGEQRAHALRAFELRPRAGDRERLFIDASYYAVVGDVPRQADALQLLIQSDPDKPSTRLLLAGLYKLTGRFEAALEEARTAARLDPSSPQAAATVGRALLDLNRFDEARAVVGAGGDSPSEPLHALRFELAFIAGDGEAMQRELTWARRTANESSAAQWEAQAHDFAGRRTAAAQSFARALSLLATRGARERIAELTALDASRDATVGRCAGVAGKVERALQVRTFNTLTLTSLSRALCADLDGASALARELAASTDLDWLNRTVSVPIIDAYIASLRSPSANAAARARSIEPYELGQQLWPIYLRGLVHVGAGQHHEAASAFQRILDQRGPAGLSIRYPLARLHLARALARSGDRAASVREYRRFLEGWKDADADLPILIDARREYASLRR